MSPSRLVLTLFIASATALFAPVSRAQVTNVDDTTSTPIEGAGHNYIHDLSETVNPANGSISLRIQIPMPKGRGITIPFGFAYDSNAANHMVAGVYPNYGSVVWASNLDAYAQGGWSTTFPTLRSDQWTVNVATIAGYSNGQPVYNLFPCYYASNYVFRDLSGGVHSTYLGSLTWNVSNPPPSDCPFSGEVASSGGDGQIGAGLPVPSQGMASAYPATLYDDAGTIYYYANPGVTTSYGVSFGAPTYIEDRNGNRVNFTQNTITDTLGRTLISGTALGAAGTTQTLSVTGGSHYQLTWTSATANYTATSAWAGLSGWPNSPYDACTAGFHLSGNPNPVVSQINLPNGQLFHFYYGTDNPNQAFQNPYGLLSEIDYPSGAWVRYTYQLGGTNLNNGTVDGKNELMVSAGLVYHAASECGASPYGPGCPYPVPDGCIYHYATPVVATRTVGLAGNNNPILTQTFTYSTSWAAPQNGYVGGTSWTQKVTQVTTTDNVTGKSSLATYTYSPIPAGTQPFANTSISQQTPLESSIQYYDWSNTTTPLRTVNKTWLDAVHLKSQQTVLETGTSSQTIYSYQADPSGHFLEVTEVDDYDFNASSPSRKTLTTYLSFSGTPGILSDKPCKSLTQDGSGNTYAETDYYYDGGTSLCGTAGTPSVTAVSNLPMNSHDETLFGPSSTTSRGNLSRVTHKCLQACTDSTTTYSYDETGQVLSMTDACGNAACSDMVATSHTTSFSYADRYTILSSGANSPYTSSYNTNAYLTTVTNPLGQISKFTYDYNNGQLTVLQNQNDINASRAGTSYIYNDPFNRPTQASYPDGGSTTISYNDSPYNPSSNPPTPNVTTTKVINSSTNLVSVAAFDGLGRTVQTRLTSDPDGVTYTATTYDGLGRPYQVYNPTRCSTPTTNCGETTWGITTTLYDGIGRTCLVAPPDATPPSSTACPTSQPLDTVLTTYSGNTTTVTDEAGNARESVTDAFGRLTKVFEDPGSSPHLNYETDYSYNPLNDLLCVAQNNGGGFSGCTSLPASWRPRTFSYDSLSRLTSATNPESGTLNYSYDANGNLSSKVSPAQNQTGSATVTLSYCYDALNRLTAKAYTAQSCPMSSPIASYLYDLSSYSGLTITNGVGRRMGMADQAGSEAWSYDSMGRPLTVQRATNGVTKSVLYTYNLDGSPYQMTYPGQSSPLTYTQGGAGRPLQLVSSGSTYISANAHYAPNGDLCYRQDDWDGSWTTTKTLNNRFQPATIQSVQQFSGSAPPVCGISQIYSGGCCTSLLDLSYSFTDASGHNNGNVQKISNNLNTERTELFTYDSLNRLATAETSSTNQPAYQGDHNFANCWGEQYTYDAWGNFTAIGSASSSYTGCNQESLSMLATTKNQLQDTNNDIVYDAAGNVTQPGPTGGPYVYDAENHLTSAGGVTYTYDGDGNRVMKSNGTIYWYGANSASLEETDLSGNILRWYYFFDGQRVARQLPTNEVGFYMTDHLGNVRYLGGSATGYSIDYYPFGGIIVNSDVGDDRYQFTGKERDAESGLDNFGARFDSSSFGRFTSPDPLLNSGRPSDPQSWNRYAYARNNPLNILDPTGLYNTPDHCTAGDRRCEKRLNKNREQLRKSVENLTKKVNDMRDGQEKARLQASLKALGTSEDGNNVFVNFGATGDGSAASTVATYNADSKETSFNVTMDTSMMGSENMTAINAAHEGTHIADISDPKFAQSATTLSNFSLEYRGYQTSAWAAQALGVPSLVYDGGANVIWNSSWAVVDRQAYMDMGITHHVTSIPRHPETTPHNPWDN